MYLGNRFEPAARLAIIILCLVSYVCLLFQISNTTPLMSMAILGGFYYFGVQKNRPSLYILWFLVFILYMVACDYFYFPPVDGVFSNTKRSLLAFLAGIAMFFACGKDGVSFLAPLPGLVAFGGVLVMLVAYVSGDTSQLYNSDRLAIFTLHPNRLGMLAGICSLVGIIYLYKGCVPQFSGGGQPWQRRLRAAGVFLSSRKMMLLYTAACLVFTFMSGSRTAVFSFSLVLLLYLLAHTRRNRVAHLAIGLACVLAAAFAVWNYAPLSDSTKERVYSRWILPASAPWETRTFISRKPMWESAIRATMQSPLLGNGAMSFSATHVGYMKENYARLVKEYGKAWVKKDTMTAGHAHNQYLSVASERGLIGLMLFAGLLLWPMISAVKNGTFYGAVIPLLLFFMLSFCTETFFHGKKAAAVAYTLFYMTIGYFSCYRGANNSPKNSG